MKTRLTVILSLAALCASPSALAVEPFHLQPILPSTGALFELRPTIYEYDDVQFGLGFLLEGRFAIGQIHGAIAFPLALAFVEDRDAAAIGDFEFGGGYGDRIGGGPGHWGAGARILVPSAPGDSSALAAERAGAAGRPYNRERHEPESTTIRLFADIGTDDPGGFVGQLEIGPDFWIPGEPNDNQLLLRFGGLAGYRIAPSTILMLELAWRDSLTASRFDGQFTFQPGVRFLVSTFDLGAYLTVPIDDPLGGDTFACGFQLLWRL